MEPARDSDRHARGLEVLKRLTAGDSTLIREMSTVDGIPPEFNEFVVDFVFGEVYTRSGLDPQRRHLVTLSCLIAVGAVTDLQAHVRMALNTGLSAQEITEAILHSAVYVGFPRAVSAMRIAHEVFVDRGIVKTNKKK